MTSSNSPSTRWTRQHGQKIKHQYPGEAQQHADELNDKRPADDSSPPWEIYPCHWGDHYKYGEVAEEHWHTGRSKRSTH